MLGAGAVMAEQKACIKCPDCHAPVDVFPTVSLWVDAAGIKAHAATCNAVKAEKAGDKK
jgi:hypothetical protein